MLCGRCTLACRLGRTVRARAGHCTCRWPGRACGRCCRHARGSGSRSRGLGSGRARASRRGSLGCGGLGQRLLLLLLLLLLLRRQNRRCRAAPLARRRRRRRRLAAVPATRQPAQQRAHTDLEEKTRVESHAALSRLSRLSRCRALRPRSPGRRENRRNNSRHWQSPPCSCVSASARDAAGPSLAPLRQQPEQLSLPKSPARSARRARSESRRARPACRQRHGGGRREGAQVCPRARQRPRA